MQWTRPDFEEISLGMEVTAYVNTDDSVRAAKEPARGQAADDAQPDSVSA